MTIALCAYAGAGALALLARRTCPLWVIHLAVMIGTGLISLAIYYWRPGEVASAVALLYVWVALYSFYFFSTPWATAHTVLVGIAYGTTLAAQPGNSAAVTVWIVTVGTASVSGGLMGSLVHRLENLADTDSLTGLPNRRGWEQFARAELARAARHGHPVSVALIDVDHFKQTNDERGHQFGDGVLQRLALAWRAQIRSGDILGRLGGDEFALVLPASDLPGLKAGMERLLAALPEQSCTVGVARWDGRETLEELLSRADKALYRGKQAGRGRALFAEEVH